MLQNFFSPQSVVVIGASEKPGKIGNDIIRNLKPFQQRSGEVFGLNPKGGEFLGIEFFTSIQNLPKIPDLAVIAIPAVFVLEALQECGEKGIVNIIIISAGFKEAGNTAGEEEIQKIGKHYTMRILGPNCLGMINPHMNLNASFAGKIPKKGNIALVSQSGAMATALMDFAESSSVGFSKIISMGNKSDLNENDFLEFLENDPETKVIVLYLESIVFGKKFFELCSRITPKKPIIIVKSGVSERGISAASSHTGALSGASEILKTAFSQSGVISTHFLEELFLWSEFFSQVDEKSIAEELIIVTNAGGPGVMAIDNAEKYGVRLAEFSEAEKSLLKKNLPDASSVENPVDILGDATSLRYEAILENISQLKKKRNILVMLTHQTTTDTESIAEKILIFQKKNPEILVMTSFMGGNSVKKGRKILEKNGILHFDYPKEGIKALSKFIHWKNSKSNKIQNIQKFLDPEISEDIQLIREKIKHAPAGILASELVSEILHCFDIPFVEEKLAKNASQVGEIFEEFSEAGKENIVVMKISSPDIAHKTDCGGVVLNIKSKEDAEAKFPEIIASSLEKNPHAEILGITLQKQIPPSREIFIGATRDATFGEVILLGLGGIYVNIFEDISRRIAPISRDDVQKMMQEIKSRKILEGYRGEKSIDFEALENTVLKISHLFHLLPEIKEIDINPVFAQEKGAWIGDAKMYI